jgi:hypothetical protein
MHPEGVAAAAPWPAASSPRLRAWPAVHRHRRKQRRGRRADQLLVAVQGLWITAASVNLRLRRPQAAGPARSQRKRSSQTGSRTNIRTGIRADAVSRRRTSGRSQIQRAYYAPLRPSGVTWRGRQLQAVWQHDLAYPVGVRRQAVAGGKLQARQVASPASRVIAMPRQRSATVSRSADGCASAGFQRAQDANNSHRAPGRVQDRCCGTASPARSPWCPVAGNIGGDVAAVAECGLPCEQAWRS